MNLHIVQLIKHKYMTRETNTVMRLVRSTGMFFIGNVLSKLMAFFLLPVYTKYIPTADFGYYDLSITYITIATSVLFFDIWVSTMRYMYDKSDIEWKNRVILSGGSIFTASSLVYIILTIAIGAAANIQYLVLISLYGLSFNIQNMYTFPARGFGRDIEFTVSGIINTVVNIIANITLIAGFKWDFSALYIAGTMGNLAQTLYLEYKIGLLRNMQLKDYDRLLTKQMFKYTFPLCVNSIAYWLLTSYNKIIINEIMSTSYNGIYAIGNKFAAAISLVASCLIYAWQDVSFSRGKDAGEFYSKAARLYIIFLGIGTALMIPAFNILFPLIINKAYWLAKGTIPLFLVCSIISTYSIFIGNIFYAIKDTKTIFISMIASCFLNLIICRIFIILMGLNGANLSIIISFILNILIRYYVLRKKIVFSFDLKSTITIFIFIGGSMIIYENYQVIINFVWLIVCGICLLFIFRKEIKMVLQSLGLRKV